MVLIILYSFIFILMSALFFVSIRCYLRKSEKKDGEKKLFTSFDYPGYPGGYVFYWKKICIEKNNQMEIKYIEKFIKDNKLVFEYDKMNVAEMEYEKIMARRNEEIIKNLINYDAELETCYLKVSGDNNTLEIKASDFLHTPKIIIRGNYGYVFENRYYVNPKISITGEITGDNNVIRVSSGLKIKIKNKGANNRIINIK
jgi:hypothetical protein